MKKSDVFQRILFLIGMFVCVMLMWIFKTGCLIRNFTGVPCPSCGMTRAFFAFINGNFKESFNLHPMLLSIPVLAFMFVFNEKLFKSKARIPSIMVLVVIFIGFIVNYIHQLSLFF